MNFTKKLLLLLSALALCAAALLAVQLGTFAASTPEYMDENGHYVTVATCGTEGTTLGTVNGAAACVRASDGALHFCDANFPSTNLRFKIAEQCIDDLYWLEHDDRSLYDTDNKAKDITVLLPDQASGLAETLKGIEYLPALQELDAAAKKVSDVDFSRNPNLVYVDISSCYVQEIDLSNNPRLEHLNMRGYDSYNVGIREIDISCCPNLTYLNVGYNSLTTLDASRNPKLEQLYITMNDIKEINLSGCTALRIFQSQNNLFTELDFSDCPNLESVQLSSDANVVSLDFSGCTAMKKLSIVGSPITSLDTSGFPNLESLTLSQTRIVSFDFSQNPKLKFGNSSSLSIGVQEIPDLAVVDGYFDLSTLEGFSLSTVKTVNETYNFVTQKRSTFGNFAEVMVGEDLLLPVPNSTHNCAYYTYLVSNADGTRTHEVSIELNFSERYNTVTFVPDAGLDVHNYTWSDGVGEKITSALMKNSATCSFDVFVQEGYVLGEEGLSFRVETVKGDTKEVSEVSGKFDDLYWIIGSITSPTTVYISGAVADSGSSGGEDTTDTPDAPVDTDEPTETTDAPVDTEEPTDTTDAPVDTDEPTETTDAPVDTDEPTETKPADTDASVADTDEPADTDTPTDGNGGNNSDTDEPAPSKGCSGTLGVPALGMLLFAALGAAATVKRKE